MTINTWIERIIKEHEGEELHILFEKGQRIYSEMRSYKHLKAEDGYIRLMQEKHDEVYKRVKQYGKERLHGIKV